MDKKLRIFAGQIVMESKMSTPTKLQLLPWLQSEATDSQVKAFLLDGKIVQLDDQAEEVVNDRFESSQINEIRVKAGFGAIVALGVARKAYQTWMSKAAKACATVRKRKGFKAAKACRIEYQIKGEHAKISSLRRDIGKCSQTSNPRKCEKVIVKSMKGVEKKLFKLQKQKGKHFAK